MDIQFMFDEDQQKMEIYTNGCLLTDYPLHSSEVYRLKQEGVTEDIEKHLVAHVCRKNFMQIINHAINIVEKNSPAAISDMFFEFPHER